jgi:CubicO group peptidase (beta-lactamase class C family)
MQRLRPIRSPFTAEHDGVAQTRVVRRAMSFVTRGMRAARCRTPAPSCPKVRGASFTSGRSRSEIMSTTFAESATGKFPVLSNGFSAGRLDRMHQILRRYVASGHLPGLVTVMARRGEVHVDSMGTLAFDSAAPMRHDTIFRLASTTKPITAVAAMILVEECKLRLDASVETWLPELADRKVLRAIDGALDDTVPAARPITLRDLLTFRCGYGEVMFLGWDTPLQRAMVAARLPLSDWPFEGTPDEFMKRLGALPLAHQPGERWLYHMGAEILGVLIARVSGQSLGTFMRERIFEPLGMKDTGFGVPQDKLGRLAACYHTDPATGRAAILEEAGSPLFARLRIFESGAGGLVSTADDLLSFGRMLVHRGVLGRERILSRAAIDLMTMDHITPEQKSRSPFFPGFWDARSWGLGLSVTTHRNDIADGSRFGWDGAYGTSFYVDPVEDLVGILMTQRRPGALGLPAVVSDFWTGVYQAIDD